MNQTGIKIITAFAILSILTLTLWHFVIAFYYGPKLEEIFSPISVGFAKGVRGSILEGGHLQAPLAVSIPAYTVWIPRTATLHPAEIARIASRMGLPINRDTLNHLSAVLEGKEEDSTIKVRRTSSKYWWVEDSEERIYPHHTATYTLGAAFLGFTDTSASGIDGLELSLNDILKGGYIPYTDGAERIPHVGLITTIHLGIQTKAEQILDRVWAQMKPVMAWIVVIDNQGEVKALAVRPTGRVDTPDRKPIFNPVIAGRFEMGSVIKPLVLAWAMEKIGLKLTDRFDDTGKLQVGDKVIRSVVPAGKNATVLKGLLLSSNVIFAQIALKMGEEHYSEMVKAFGLSEKTGIELPGEVCGTPPPPGETYLAVAGYGYSIWITPIELLRAYTAIANDGILMPITIVKGFYLGDKFIRWYRGEATRVLSPDVAKAVRQALVQVVENSAPKARVFLDGKEIKVAGKTGTAEVALSGGYSEKEKMFNFIGMLPADKPKYIVLVSIYRPKKAPGRFASQVAAPVFKEMAEYLAILLKSGE